MLERVSRWLVLLLVLLMAGCSRATPTPQYADVTVQFDLAGGGSGFSLVIYAQNVETGESVSQSPSFHTIAVRPRSRRCRRTGVRESG